MAKVYERVIFLQGNSADEALEIYNQHGAEAALLYLEQWHYPGEHETATELGAGTSDRVYEIAGYILTVNTRVGYIGLEYEVSRE